MKLLDKLFKIFLDPKQQPVPIPVKVKNTK